MYFNL